MKTRAKFICDNVLRHEDGNVQWVMRPVYHDKDPNHENSKFWEFTPMGSLDMTVSAKYQGEHPEPGKEYYVDITPAS